MRGRKVPVLQVACPNCGNVPFQTKMIQKAESPGDSASKLWVGLFASVGLLGWMGTMHGAALCWFTVAVGVALTTVGLVKRRHRLRQEKAVQDCARKKFEELRHQFDELNTHAHELYGVLKDEADAPVTDRGTKRMELLGVAYANRRDRMRMIEGEIWARDVQLWLNQVEGLLAERIPKLHRDNSEEVRKELRRLMAAGKQLLRQSDRLEPLSSVPQRAREVLEKCLATAPELEERIRDARVLAAVRRGPDYPQELTENSAWLHWLRDAMPSIELLPTEFSEDEEFLQVQTELRMLRDSFPAGSKTQSLDRPANSLDQQPGQREM